MTPKPAVAPPVDDAAAGHAEAQRRRILDAAQKCFITRGFHAGSIGDIAAEAEISQGLMYRYFANKRTLILALIERQLRHDQASISEMPAASDLVDGLLECYRQWARGAVLPIHGNAIASVALYAEINAEAHRDPMLAQVLRTHDKQTSAAIHDWLRQHDARLGRPIDEEAIAGRTLLLRLLVEGLAMRAVRDPDLPPARVRALLADAIGRVMAD
ncbi:TPA: TetR/AcrR family transcriptional regulator [Stenotrophomonas maltophilia]|uniref:TetR/AcrR family transcriptional regulator n=1 Tax=Stenotrophomonas maltophilia TaxID=40324 RepID=UPI001312F624|nr:TetR/AcrR family transcriptional regulator [Stenotrophomonas maltophilia]HEL3813338.1 TetR/AcrR family transcriptional regulator [Stenotrophomonas maltophilia]